MTTTEDIADGVVALLAAIVGPLVPAIVRKPEIVPEYESEDPSGPKLDVIPFGEAETSIDQGDACSSLLTVTIVASWPLTADRDRAQSIAALREFRQALRQTTIGRYRWQSCDVVSLFDAEVLRTKNRFLSVFRATYFDVN